MLALRTKLLLALDAGAVAGAALSIGWRGREIQNLARRPLSSGALVPGAFAANVQRAEEVREAVRAVAAETRAADRPLVLVLPDGLARTALLDVPARTEPVEFARFRLASQLPYPIAEAVVDVVRLGGARVLAAAVRRDVVAEYEQLASACALALERVDLVPLAALGALWRVHPPEPHVDVVLGEAAFSMALSAAGTVVAFRTRRRDPGPDEPERLALEIERTARLGEVQAAPTVRVVGPGARRLAEAWSAIGLRAQSGWGSDRLRSEEAPDLAWLGAGF